jgi:hypothetical protein
VPQKAAAAAVVASNNWNDPYWNTHKYGYWHGHKGYWVVKNGRHVFVVVPSERLAQGAFNPS